MKESVVEPYRWRLTGAESPEYSSEHLHVQTINHNIIKF